MHEGVPPGGAQAPQLLARANVAALNRRDEAAIELFGAMTVVARAPLTIATDGGVARPLSRDDRFTVASGPSARMRYIAVRGGFDVPQLLGGRGTLLVANLGGHEGRPLRRGDLLHLRNAIPNNGPMPPTLDLDAPVRVVLGPDVDRFDRPTVEAFLAATFTIEARSDRVGICLAGPRLVREHEPDSLSAPMVRGAIQIPPSGQPIVLGPDHPTTGGYPVIATVVQSHLGSLGARPIGAPVRFVV
jgi:biotin-dependent carboxylase-like uncharacterized protein